MKITAIINSVSQPDKRRAVLSTLSRVMAGHDLTTCLTKYPGHATELAAGAVADKADIIVIAGGDGTIGQVVNGTIGSETRLGIIPTGTANDLARYFRIPGSLDEACDVILTGTTRRIDAIKFNDRYFVTTAGLGIGCETIAKAQQLRRLRYIGRPVARLAERRLYALGYALAVAEKQGWPCRLNVRRNGLDISRDTLSLTISNLPQLGTSFNMAPVARVEDGYFDICLIEDHGRLGAVASGVRASRNSLAGAPRTRHWQARSALIQCEQPLPFFADGELMPAASRFEISIAPKAVSLITPFDPEVN